MSLESRFRHVLAVFGQPMPTAGKGKIFRPCVPIDLTDALGVAATRRVATDRIEPLFEFGLRTPPHGGAAALGMLWIGDRGGLVCASMPRRSLVALAALLPASEPALLSDFLLRFLGRNGRRFGINVLDGLPLWIRNRRPDLLDRRSMKRALWAWMICAERRRLTSWPMVRAHVADRWGRDDWPSALSHADRRQLLAMYLAALYVEAARPAAQAPAE